MKEFRAVFKPSVGSSWESSRFHYSDIRPAVRERWRPVVVEIGVLTGEHTRLLLNACLPRLGRVIGIDPAPAPAISRVMSLHPLAHMMKTTSLEALNQFAKRRMEADIVLVDGDHNYFTVFNELLLIEKILSPTGVVFLHDVRWPYARRDLYYDPERIPASARHPFARAGIVEGKSELVSNGGTNANLLNALHEGGPKNGVLTAVEDFIGDRQGAWTFEVKPEFYGLGILRRAPLDQ